MILSLLYYYPTFLTSRSWNDSFQILLIHLQYISSIVGMRAWDNDIYLGSVFINDFIHNGFSFVVSAFAYFFEMILTWFLYEANWIYVVFWDLFFFLKGEEDDGLTLEV